MTPCSVSQRIHHLHSQCKHLGYNQSSHVTVTPANEHLFHNVLADDNHNVLYCVIPKVGSTSWKSMLYRSVVSDSELGKFSMRAGNLKTQYFVHNNKYLTKHGFKWLRLPYYSYKGIEHRLQNYFKFVVVRHPLARLISLYNNKFVQRKEFPWVIRQVLKKENKTGYDITSDVIHTAYVDFEALADFLVTSNKVHADKHWDSYDHLCHPCLINYDFVAKMETLDRDLDYVRSMLRLPRHLEHLNPSKAKDDKKFTLSDVKSIGRNTLEGVYRTYKEDFLMFGYGFKEDGTVICDTGGIGCC